MNSNIKKIIVIALILSVTAVAALYAQQAPANNGQGAGYSQGYGRHSGDRGKGGAGCNNQAMLQTYGKYADNPNFAKMLQEKDAIRSAHRKETLARSEAHRVEMRNITLNYAAKLNSAKTAAEKTAVTTEMNKALNDKRTAFRTSSATVRSAHLKQMTAFDGKYNAEFPDYYKNKGTYGKGTGTNNCTGTGRGSGSGKGNGRGRGNGNGKGCPGC